MKLDLRCFDAAGRLLRGEWFDADRAADALARFDEADRRGAAAPPRARERGDARRARLRRRDARAPRSTASRISFAEDLRSLSHETGIDMTRDEMLRRMRFATSTAVRCGST